MQFREIALQKARQKMKPSGGRLGVQPERVRDLGLGNGVLNYRLIETKRILRSRIKGGVRKSLSHAEITLEIDPKIAPILFGEYDQNLKDIAAALDVMLSARGNTLFLAGDAQKVDDALAVLEQLRSQAEKGTVLGPHEIRYTVDVLRRNDPKENGEVDFTATPIQVTNRGKRITPRTYGQKAYIEAIRDHVLTFGIGRRGPKTYLAVAWRWRLYKANR